MRPTVLIAEADKLLASAYTAFLVAEGFHAQRVASGLECLEALRERPYQALILDAELRWGSWSGVLEVMNQDPGIEVVPVVILTARPGSLCWPAPACHSPVTLLKPIAPLSMARIVRNLLKAEPAGVDA